MRTKLAMTFVAVCLLSQSVLALDAAVLETIGRIRFPGPSCTGILVAPRWVLTAAHCLSGQLPSDARFSLENDAREPGLFAEGVAMHVHPGFLNSTKRDVTDVALLQLASENYGRRPKVFLERFESARVLTMEPGVLVGFGLTRKGDPGTRYVKQVLIDSPTVGAKAIVHPGPEGETFCAGDSGGPVLKYLDGAWKIMAIGSASAFKKGTLERNESVPTAQKDLSLCKQVLAGTATWLPSVNEWLSPFLAVERSVAGDAKKISPLQLREKKP